MNESPNGEVTIQVLAMPADTNPSGDVFGGWLLSEMDIAGGVFCRKIAKGPVVTVAVNQITFKQPVFVGDTLRCYVDLIKVGTTSITVHIEAWVNREYDIDKSIKVTQGDYTYVKVDENRNPVKIEKNNSIHIP
jgi:acyl-CoA thioesterase YciA